MMIKELEREARFRQQCFLCDESNGSQKVKKEITQIQRRAHCVRRGAWLMAALTALAGAGLGYPVILLENFPYSAPQFMNVFCALGVGSLISLLAFVCLGMVYREKLSQQKEACQTRFLRQCMVYDESNGLQKLEEEISQIQRDAHCVQRSTWLMAALTALAVACLGYPGFVLENLFDKMPQFIVNLICALGVGSLISLLAFVCLGMVYREKLAHRRLECCEMAARLLASRLGKPG